LLALKGFVAVAVCLGVSGTLQKAATQLAQQDWEVRAGWLGVSGMLYLVGLTAMGWFWHRTLGALGQHVPWWATQRAYFLGHLGKYVPGKAFVLILRVAGVRRWVASLRIAVVSILLETLTMMAVGAFLAASLAMLALRLPMQLTVLAVMTAIGAGLPTMPPVMRWLARLDIARMRRQAALDEVPDEVVLQQVSTSDVDASLQGISLSLVASGWLAASVCWVLLGWSLWAALRAIGVEQLHPLADLPLLVVAVSIAVVAGFLSLLPGGILVRDALVMQLLAPICGDANALVAAVMLRLVWLVSEIGFYGILNIGGKAVRASKTDTAI